MNSLPPLNVVYSKRQYVRNNCYLSQISKVLKQHFQVNPIFLYDYFPKKELVDSDFPVLVMVQARLLESDYSRIKRILGIRQVLIYDQDPWESFIDGGSIKGAYNRLSNEFAVSSYLVTSKWWTQFINQRGIKTQYLQMGVLPKFMKADNLQQLRKNHIFFQGTMHPYRHEFFQRLSHNGIQVNTLKSEKYRAFLKNLRNSRIFLHVGHPNWRIDGELFAPNCCWIKDIEAAAQGCFSIRNFETEYSLQDLNNIPLIQTFEDEKDVLGIINEIESLSDVEIVQIIKDSMEYISQNMSWTSIVNVLENSRISQFTNTSEARDS